MTETEIWKVITGYEGLYQVSNLGRIKSLKYNHTNKEKLLKQGNGSTGYLMVVLYKQGKKKTTNVHRLVAEAFLENPDNLTCINHKDENKHNNRVDNLEFCSVDYNNHYGTRSTQAEFKSKPVKCVETGVIYSSAREASELMGLNRNAVSNSIFKEYKCAGYTWEYSVLD